MAWTIENKQNRGTKPLRGINCRYG